jgi:hypothetical protein
MKAKRFALAIIAFLVVLALVFEFRPVFASVESVRGDFPWTTEYISTAHNVSDVSTSYTLENNFSPRPDIYFGYDDDPLHWHAWRRAPSGSYPPCLGSLVEHWSCIGGGSALMDSLYRETHVDSNILYVRGLVTYDVEPWEPYVKELNYGGYFYENDFLVYQITERIIEFADRYGLSIGSAPALAFDQDQIPHVAVLIQNSISEIDALLYLHYTGVPNTSCTTFFGGNELWECEVVQTGVNSMKDPSIAIGADNLPGIAYFNPNPIRPRVEYAYKSHLNDTCDGTTGWRCITIGDANAENAHASAANGKGMHIAYYDGANLMLAAKVSIGANCGDEDDGPGLDYQWRCDEIDQVGADDMYVDLSLVMDGTEPLIAYSDTNDGERSVVKFAQHKSRTGLMNGNCGPELPLLKNWSCQIIKQGENHYGQFLDLAAGWNGLVHIAYTESIPVPETLGINHLLVSYQMMPNYIPLVNRE